MNNKKLPQTNLNNKIKWFDNERFIAIFQAWKYYSQIGGIHGIRYFTANNLHWTERITWFILVMMALFGSIYVSILLRIRYTTGLLSTVVESTYYQISDVPFPGITICNYNRLNYNKMNDTIQKFIPNETNETKKKFRLLLETFESLDFGSFDELLPVVNYSFKSLEHINLTAVWEYTMHTCEETFIECWWRIKYYNCCELFTIQKTEYGICHSFNSATSDASPLVNRTSTDWPWRTSSFGEWSGLRVVVNVRVETRLKHSINPIGLMVIIHHPYEWPNIGNYVPGGSATSIAIKPTSFYTSADVRRFSPEQRQCIYQDEANTAKYGKVMKLDGLPYLRPNCIAQCRQLHMLKYCNCTLEFYYPKNIFNYEKPLDDSMYFDEHDDGISCPCLPECARTTYDIEIQPNLFSLENRSTAILNIFFKSQTMVRYRTDATFGWLDLLVSFGGIIGLFLGASLLSCVEIIYHLTLRLYWHLSKYHRENTKNNKIDNHNTMMMMMMQKNNNPTSISKLFDDSSRIYEPSMKITTIKNGVTKRINQISSSSTAGADIIHFNQNHGQHLKKFNMNNRQNNHNNNNNNNLIIDLLGYSGINEN